jgi:hypothetical protein
VRSVIDQGSADIDAPVDPARAGVERTLEHGRTPANDDDVMRPLAPERREDPETGTP